MSRAGEPPARGMAQPSLRLIPWNGHSTSRLNLETRRKWVGKDRCPLGQMPSRTGFPDLSFKLDVQKESLKFSRSSQHYQARCLCLSPAHLSPTPGFRGNPPAPSSAQTSGTTGSWGTGQLLPRTDLSCPQVCHHPDSWCDTTRSGHSAPIEVMAKIPRFSLPASSHPKPNPAPNPLSPRAFPFASCSFSLAPAWMPTKP